MDPTDEKRLSDLEQKVTQLVELIRSIMHELPADAQARIAWKLVNEWIEKGAK